MTFLNSLVSKLELPKGIWRKIVLIGLSAFFINVGIDHFINPDFYLSIMPPAFPLHAEAVYISGFFEILGGIGVLIPRLRRFSGWGLVALLVATKRATNPHPENRLNLGINTPIPPSISKKPLI